MHMGLSSIREQHTAEVEKNRWKLVAGNSEGGRADLISKNPAELSWFIQMSTPSEVNCKCSSDPAMEVD